MKLKKENLDTIKQAKTGWSAHILRHGLCKADQLVR